MPTQQEKLIDISAELIMDISQFVNILRRIAKGERGAKIPETSQVESLRDLAKEINIVVNEFWKKQDEIAKNSQGLVDAVKKFNETLQMFIQGNMEARAPTDFKLEALVELSKGINHTLDQLQKRNSEIQGLLKELETPSITIWKGVVVMPLIGTLSTERASRAMITILTAITNQKAEIGIIDVTGVPVIDTMVADNLLRTVKAIKIIGAEPILTGISPEVASTIVKMGIEMGEVLTKSTLEDGLKYALELLGYKISHG
ncbi:MAG: STAS domain-containing protein [bacterium]